MASADDPTAEFEPLPEPPRTHPSGGGGGLPPDKTTAAAAGDPGPPGPPGYEIIRELGDDGVCRVYLAREVALSKVVALKLLPGGGPGRAYARDRFLDTARTTARLQHPGIVPIYDAGEYAGGAFVAMKYIDGVSLAEVLAASPLKPRAAAEVVAALAGAVGYAHQQGVIHRDLKPANVLVGGYGEVMLTGFGLARRTDAPPPAEEHVVIGTPAYMAPEQARGDAGRVGPAADIWGLGAVLYHCLTGRPPFRGATAIDTILQVVTKAPDPPRMVAPDIPRDLEAITLKGLEKAPADRYASAADLADDLDRFRDGRPVAAAARAGSWWGRVWNRGGRPARVTPPRPPAAPPPPR